MCISNNNKFICLQIASESWQRTDFRIYNPVIRLLSVYEAHRYPQNIICQVIF